MASGVDRPASAASRKSRPASSHSTKSSGSREAWKEPELYGLEEEGERADTSIAPTPWSEDGEAPMAMENETFDEGPILPVQPRGVQMQPVGFWFKFKTGIRGIWKTRMTDDVDHDKEKMVNTTLRELIIYLVFLVIACISVFGMLNTNMFFFTKATMELFLDAHSITYDKTFRTTIRTEQAWDFLEHALMDGLYWEEWYDKKPVTEKQSLFVFYDNKILGLPRLRLKQVHNDSCTVAKNFREEFNQCYDAYADSKEDKTTFGPVNDDLTGFKWQSTDENGGGGSYSGTLGRYGGGGYVQDLFPTKAQSLKVIAELKSKGWVTRGTRAIFIDFTLYNANLNLFCVVRLLIEFPATGGTITAFHFRTVKLIRYVSSFDYFVLVCEFLFAAFVVYYVFEEIIEIKRHKCSYFHNFWNVLDVLLLVISIAIVVFNVYRYFLVDKLLGELLNNPHRYANFEEISYIQTRFNDLVAILMFMIWIKIFKYIGFNKTMLQLTETLARSARDVGGFSVMFFIFFFAFCQLGFLLFGQTSTGFSTLYRTTFTLLRTTLGDFDYSELTAANRVLGPAYFLAFIFLVFFVLLNMFLAIINDTYAEVKMELAMKKNDFELKDYVKMNYYSMLRKMNLRKDKLVDIRAALKACGSETKKTVDFDDWRKELRRRGYADSEIESMFSKYDLDGDRELDEEEQKRMAQEMEGQQLALDQALCEGESDGSPTARTDFDDFESGDFVPLAGRKPADTLLDLHRFEELSGRVRGMEESISGLSTKIDRVIGKVEELESLKIRHTEKVFALMRDVEQTKGGDTEKLGKFQKGLEKALDRFDRNSTSPDSRMSNEGSSSSGKTSRSSKH